MGQTPVVVVVVVVAWLVGVWAQFQWQGNDAFDRYRAQLDRVSRENCKIVDINDLFLPIETVTHVPNIRTLGIDPVFPNRTNLLHINNMALARAFFYSYILQKAPDDFEPGFMYHFLSVIADVGANRFINSSGLYFSPNMAFTPSYKGFFNKTMPLFAPRAYRADDFNDPYHLQGTSTLNTIEAIDLGAVPNNSISANYTHELFKINEWFQAWLPDRVQRQDSKRTYTVQITHLNGTNETFVWHGPPDAPDIPGPMKWVRPYFDCGRSNKWVYGVSVPVVDIFPRHTRFRHIEYPTYVAVSVMELDFERIDINQCPITNGNPPPNLFAGTARCKNDTTECEPIDGFGFRRGGYQCRCRPGFRLPKQVRTPYLGEIVERATMEERKRTFDCERISYMMVMTQDVAKLPKLEGNRYVAMMKSRMELSNSTFGMNLDPSAVIRHIRSEVTKLTCAEIAKTDPEKLFMRSDITFGKESQLENEARMAVRLAHFISSFQQVVDPKELFAEFRVPDKPLTEDQIIGEVLSTVIGNKKIQGCGVFFDRDQFPNKALYAPYAYRRRANTRNFFVEDISRRSGDQFYLNKEWFKLLKVRWSSNLDDLVTYTAKIEIRLNSTGHHPIRYDHFPLQYLAAEMEHGYWSAPYFDCSGFHDMWLITYAAPFFGWDKIRNRKEFKGVVAVNMRLEDLDINQCSENYYAKNAFKDTHKCDRRSSWCVPIQGRGFEPGGYKCECRQGYEYPFSGIITYFDGQVVEAEFDHILQDMPSRYDTYKCRIAAAETTQSSWLLTVLLGCYSLRWFLQ